MIAKNDVYDIATAAKLHQAHGSEIDSQFNEALATYQDGIQAGYHAGNATRYLPVPAGIDRGGSNADYHYRHELSYLLMMERARADDRDNMVIGQGINRLVSNVMQSGNNHDPDTGDKQLDKDLKQEYADHCADPDQVDYEGEKDFKQLSRMGFRHSIVDGDVFYLPTELGSIQHFEGHHCRNPFGTRNTAPMSQNNKTLTGIVNGVQLHNGKRVGFHFTPQSIGPYQSQRFQSRMVRTRDSRTGDRQVFQVYNPKRLSQRRGVTTMAPMVFPTNYHDDAQFATLVNLKRQSFIAILHSFDINADMDGAGKTRGGSRKTGARADGSTRTTEGGGPGQDYFASTAGERIEAWTPNIPSAQFLAYCELLLAIMAVNLDLPMMVFMLDVSKGNFNNYRGVMDQARMRFREFQRNQILQLETPAYLHWLRRRIGQEPAYRNAARRAGINIRRHSITPEGWPYIQPVQDAAADDMRRTRNLTSDRRAARERGFDQDQISREIVEDRGDHIVRAIERANEINGAYEDANVNWREIAWGQANGSVRVSLNGSIDEVEETKDKKDDSTST